MKIEVKNQKNLVKLIAYLKRPRIIFNMQNPITCIGGACHKMNKKGYWSSYVSSAEYISKVLGITEEESIYLYRAEFSSHELYVSKEETIEYLETLVT